MLTINAMDTQIYPPTLTIEKKRRSFSLQCRVLPAFILPKNVLPKTCLPHQIVLESYSYLLNSALFLNLQTRKEWVTLETEKYTNSDIHQ